MTLAGFDLSILWPALVAGLLVTATHVPLGTQVLARGIVFIDLAIAQIAGCGVLLADRLGFEAEGIAVQVSALLAALAGGLLLLASNPHANEHLQSLLVGQILWAQPKWLAWAALVYAGVLAVWFGAGE